MTRRSSATKSPPKAKQPSAPDKPDEPLIQLKPRRGLFFILLGVFILWIAFLLALYFTTVYHKTDVHEQRPPVVSP
jgi:hypothetical protein